MIEGQPKPEEIEKLERNAKQNPPLRIRHHIPSEGSCNVKAMSPGSAPSVPIDIPSD
ncbi:hypothetical protein RHGRI_025759 [Rhododendron griersonianum]|uniref:Uncharacterized protein n=1 Tax=Rhododendron griersonianum TaxID=479676 RepID=A0AAV6IVG5_9ERIC|nr:hypothetical protein RHGRI_025759 [Rhododendron griersonianum]